jgi:hypothetical protein
MSRKFEATVLGLAEAEFVREFSTITRHAVAGDLIGDGYRGRLLSLVEIRSLLLEPGLVADKDTVWRYLVEQARAHGGAWTVAVVGMATPMLKRTAAIAASRFQAMRKDDLAAEILTAFLEHAAAMDLDRPGICLRLRWATWRATVKAATREEELPAVRIEAGFSMPPSPPCSHPDVVLARAERAGVLTPAEADLIGMTRLDEVTLAEAAQCLDITVNAAKIRRQKAETRLVAFLTGQPIPHRMDLKRGRTRAQCAKAA